MNLTATDMSAISVIVSAICALAGVFIRLTIKNMIGDAFTKFGEDLSKNYVSSKYFEGYREQQIRELGRLEGEVKSLESNLHNTNTGVQKQLQTAHVSLALIKMKIGMTGGDHDI